jgi:hypothetical protein
MKLVKKHLWLIVGAVAFYVFFLHGKAGAPTGDGGGSKLGGAG